ncbi:PREDICTED: uncharacterized protein LOC105143027 isoform X1 [Acromyrmex echinatior]|uniref:uncharacterized protein LOC105143027 isoform X1 n=1 Tax=Acromyrmex echinatior TaxID=103372 RepID=UPI00058106F8|nr:PREDICTED: uncharacterized protein LOC105143027 isoform X1 [Acromyrmex echinatior]
MSTKLKQHFASLTANCRKTVSFKTSHNAVQLSLTILDAVLRAIRNAYAKLNEMLNCHRMLISEKSTAILYENEDLRKSKRNGASDPKVERLKELLRSISQPSGSLPGYRKKLK